jgi:hypothetical protein
MATSSKYVQLSSSVLMEYIYSDQEQINVPGNEFRISTVTAPIWKMSNAHSGEDQILNADSAEILQDGLPVGTANVRNRSFAPILPYKGALLDINKVVFYNDYDPDLTSTPNLPINFTNPQAPVYDTIRLHLVQGFNFEDNFGFVLSIKCKKKNGENLVLANYSYNREDSFDVINPNPFFFGGRIYNSYVEIRVLSLFNLIYDYWLGVLNGDTVAERITDQNGVMRNQMISVYFAWAREREIIESQEYITFVDTKTIDLPVRDQFDNIAAYISESDTGDYIEYYATYGGNIIENYILDLNNSGYDFILLHDLTISEYLYDPTTATYSWVKTDDVQTTQTDEYDKPNLYRPIVKNTNAIAFKIDYTVRLYNRTDNSQVWKTASVISQSASKYGRKLRSINLGANPIQTKIYNQNVVKDIQINRITEPVLNMTKYITSFSNNSNISIITETVNPTPEANPTPTTLINAPSSLQTSGTSNLQIFGNGLGRILIPDSVCFLKFTLFQKQNEQNTRMNLSGIGDLYLVFDSGQGEYIEIIEFPNEYTNKGGGEVVFRLSENDTKRVLALTTRSFKIFIENETGDRTFLYAGDFYSVKEFQEIEKNNRAASLESQLTALTTQIGALTTTINQQKSTIDNLSALNKNLQDSVDQQNALINQINENSTAQSVAATAQQQIDQKDSQINLLNQTIENLNNQVSQLTESFNQTVAQLSANNGLTSTQTQNNTTNSNTNTSNETVGKPKPSPKTIGKLVEEKVKANLKKDPASSQSAKNTGKNL